jgi:hypothetical protein
MRDVAMSGMIDVVDGSCWCGAAQAMSGMRDVAMSGMTDVVDGSCWCRAGTHRLCVRDEG